MLSIRRVLISIHIPKFTLKKYILLLLNNLEFTYLSYEKHFFLHESTIDYIFSEVNILIFILLGFLEIFDV